MVILERVFLHRTKIYTTCLLVRTYDSGLPYPLQFVTFRVTPQPYHMSHIPSHYMCYRAVTLLSISDCIPGGQWYFPSAANLAPSNSRPSRDLS